jgi:hypothetical protein
MTRQDGAMTTTTEEAAAEVAPVKVSFDSIRWEVDFGGGITQRFSDYGEAITAAQRAAANEGRDVDVASTSSGGIRQLGVDLASE